MKIYYESNIDLASQKQDALKKLDNQSNIQIGNQKLLSQTLLNLNNIIQNIDNAETLNKLSEILKKLKANIDITRKNISILEKLKTQLNSLNLEDISNPETTTALENYNTSISKHSESFYESQINTNSFILEYLKYTENYSLPLARENTAEIVQNQNIEPENSSTKTIENEIIDNPKDSLEIPIEEDNKTLLISEIKNKVFLPYSIAELKYKLENSYKYNSIEEIINTEYIIPLSNYKNSIIARFKEAFNLMRKREKASISDCLDLALELSFNNLLNPAIITACKNLDELDVYLDCLNSNELDKFTLFEIKYEVLPRKK